jgi:translation initiation factor 3 subunit A
VFLLSGFIQDRIEYEEEKRRVLKARMGRKKVGQDLLEQMEQNRFRKQRKQGEKAEELRRIREQLAGYDEIDKLEFRQKKQRQAERLAEIEKRHHEQNQNRFRAKQFVRREEKAVLRHHDLKDAKEVDKEAARRAKAKAVFQSLLIDNEVFLKRREAGKRVKMQEEAEIMKEYLRREKLKDQRREHDRLRVIRQAVGRENKSRKLAEAHQLKLKQEEERNRRHRMEREERQRLDEIARHQKEKAMWMRQTRDLDEQCRRKQNWREQERNAKFEQRRRVEAKYAHDTEIELRKQAAFRQKKLDYQEELRRQIELDNQRKTNFCSMTEHERAVNARYMRTHPGNSRGNNATSPFASAAMSMSFK